MGLFGRKKHSIGNTIAELRKEKGWTQTELADKLQVSDKAVSKWEKDHGVPSVEFFPALAELFGVSIDYIMTGKKPEPEIITISKVELCAKNDDPTMLESIAYSVNTKDENGKSLMDYIKQYDSKKVLTKLVDSCSYSTNYMSLFPKNIPDLAMLLNLIKIDRETIVLKNISRCNKDLRDIYSFGDRIVWGDTWQTNSPASEGYKEIFSYMVVNYDNLTNRQQEYYFNLGCEDIAINNCWAYAYRYLIHEAYKSNRKLFEKLIKKVFANNKIYEEKASKIREEAHGSLNWMEHQLGELRYKNSYVHILKDTVLAAIENEDYELAKKLNLFTEKKVEDDVFEQAKIKHNKKLSEEEKTIQSCIHYGILNIGEVLATKNMELIKQAINNYPIHPIEIPYKMLKNKEWRALFEYAVDNNYTLIASAIIEDAKIENIEKEIVTIFKKDLPSGYGKGYLNVNGKSIIVRDKELYSHSSINEIIEYILSYKQQVISDAYYDLQKEKTIGDLTKDYFDKELEEGNIEMVIINLCKRLEIILRSSYHYEGDLYNMLNKYCKENLHCNEDDGWGYIASRSDDKTIKLLNALRMKRNSIAHSVKADIELSKADLQYCIDYICNMK